MELSYLDDALTRYLAPITQNPIFLEMGIMGIFILALLPLPIPQEIYISPLILATPEDQKLGILMTILLPVLLAEFIQHSLIFFAIKHHWHKLPFASKHSEKSSQNSIHRYGVKFLIVAPIIGIVIPYTDAIAIAYIGHHGGKASIVLPYILFGFAIRGVISFFILKEVFGI